MDEHNAVNFESVNIVHSTNLVKEAPVNFCSRVCALNCFFVNARGLRSKIDILQEYASVYNLDIIGIVETFTNKDIPSAEIAIDGYKIYRKDRDEIKDCKGGGVVLYVKDKIVSYECEELNKYKCESVWCKLKINEKSDITIGVCYRSQAISDNEIEILFEAISKASQGHVLIMGDFNYPKIDWDNLEADSYGSKFRDLVLDNFLVQHVSEPTRGNNILDLILTSQTEMVEGVKIHEHIGNSDHNIIMWKLVTDVARTKMSKVYRQYHKCNYEDMKRWLGEIDWNEEFKNLDVNAKWDRFCVKLHEAVEQFVPVGTKRNSKFPKWSDKSTRAARRHKIKMWNQYKETKHYFDYQKYKKAQNLATKVYRKAKLRFEFRLSKEIKTNPKGFYAYVKSKTSVKDVIGPLRDNDGNLTSDNINMCGILNSYFGSVFTREIEDKGLPEVTSKITHNKNHITRIKLTKDMVFNKLKSIKPNKAPGVDEIVPRILLENAAVLSEPLFYIFEESLSHGCVPLDWKKANVTPIFKKGAKDLPNNYRPISLTSQVCKILESIIRDNIIRHLKENCLINPTQHGFWSKRSCLSNLLEFLEFVTSYVDKGVPVDVIYLDFQKAFDKVPHLRLLEKVKSMGIEGEIYQWIKSWLVGRQQRVVMCGGSSDWIEVNSGVPQGSVLGPLLFLIYINDIDEWLNCKLLKFADDTKLFTSVASKQDIERLQQDLVNICRWSKEWLMLFNKDKCKVMHIGLNNPQIEYTMDGLKLEEINEERDLGIIMQNDLKCTKQCAKAVNTANKLLGMIKRNFSNLNQQIVLSLYKTLVRPHLEYCIQAWCPHLQKDIELLEKVQRRVTKLVPALKHVSYEERLLALKLTTLATRRLRGDLIEVFKLFKGFTDVDPDKFFTLNKLSTRGHSLKLHKSACKHDFRKFFFSQRVVDMWNGLPENTVNCGSVNVFKSRIDKYLLNRGFI